MKKKKVIIIKIIVIIMSILALIGLSVFLLYKEKKKMIQQINQETKKFSIELQQKDTIINDKNGEINNFKIEQHKSEHRENELQKENDNLKNENSNLIKENNKLKQENNKLKTSKVTSRSSTTSRVATGDWEIAEITAYCGCAKCCGKTDGRTASGTKATPGRTIAASSKYAFGTKIEIENLGVYTVEDRGGAIQGNKIDIFFNCHQEALNFGRKTMRIRVVQ